MSLILKKGPSHLRIIHDLEGEKVFIKKKSLEIGYFLVLKVTTFYFLKKRGAFFLLQSAGEKRCL